MELLGDEELDRAVRAAWRRLDQAGFSSLAQHRHPTNRPHLTLASAGQYRPAAAVAIAAALRMLPIPVRLGGPQPGTARAARPGGAGCPGRRRGRGRRSASRGT
ncbi:MAG TPA: hypothetical protein VGI96_29395 [Streptosporangiaceae bacterium]